MAGKPALTSPGEGLLSFQDEARFPSPLREGGAKRRVGVVKPERCA